MYSHSQPCISACQSTRNVGPVVLWAGLPCNQICISTKNEREIKRARQIAEGAFFLKACLVEHSYYESINPHYDTLLFLSFTAHCQSSNGNITVTVFKSHIQYLLFSQLQLERNVNKPYKPCRALTPCYCTAGFIMVCVMQHMVRALAPLPLIFLKLGANAMASPNWGASLQTTNCCSFCNVERKLNEDKFISGIKTVSAGGVLVGFNKGQSNQLFSFPFRIYYAGFSPKTIYRLLSHHLWPSRYV